MVEDLSPKDFQVTEDGKPQSVEFFEFLKFGVNPRDSERRDPQTAEEGERLVSDPHHRAFVAYFDTYHLPSRQPRRSSRAPAIEFLERTIGSTDYFAAMIDPETPTTRLTFGQRTETVIETEVRLPSPIRSWRRSTPAYIPVSGLHEKWLKACYERRWANEARDNALLTGAVRAVAGWTLC